MKDLWIVGGGGAALEVWAVAQSTIASFKCSWRLQGFLVIDDALGFDPEDLEVRNERSFLRGASADEVLVVLAIGDPKLRMAIARRYADHGFGFTSLVHPTAVIGPRCRLGVGSVVMAQAVLETDVSVGSHALLNVGCSIAHNGVLGDFCNLGPGARLAGWVTLGDRCDLGVGCNVRPRIILGSDTCVGAGAAVIRNCEGRSTLVGVPARALKQAVDDQLC